MTEELEARYLRLLTLEGFGALGHAALRKATVLISGCGGLGHPVITYLATIGVGHLILVDPDIVDESNLARQFLFSPADIGRAKVDVVKSAVETMNPGTTVTTLIKPIEVAGSQLHTSGCVLHAIVDCADNFAARHGASRLSQTYRVPHVWGAATGWDGQMSVFLPDGPTYRDLHPHDPPPEVAQDCELAGVFSPVCGIVGTLMASETTKVLLPGAEPLVGKVVVVDAQGGHIDVLPFIEPAFIESAAADRVGTSDPDCESVTTEPFPPVEFVTSESLDWSHDLLVDVREEYERRDGMIHGAVACSMSELMTTGLPSDIDSTRRVVLYCGGDSRSVVAAHILGDSGRRVAVLEGGYAVWDSQGELVVLLDDDGNPSGVAPKSTVHDDKTPRHLAFSCYLLDDDGQVMLSRRALTKLTWPGVWTNSACGHPAPDERLEDAVVRRLDYELGIRIAVDDVSCVLPTFEYRATDASGVVEHELCPVFVVRVRSGIVPKLRDDEVMDWAWAAWDDLVETTEAMPFAFSPWMVSQVQQMAQLPTSLSAI